MPARDRRSRLVGIASTVSTAAILTCWAGTAMAQEAVGVEDIIVTAQRREQNVQDVPIAVTALSQNAIEVNRVQSVNDLTGLAPGLISRQNAGSLGSPSFAMRGVFATASAASQDRQISTYIDGVYIGGVRGSSFDLPDTQRIEVLRGPQGTLFGRNATAGAINIVTRDPSGELHFRQDVTIGNYSQLRTRTTIDSPQIGPFSAFVTYVHDERRGDVRNLGVGTTFDYTNPFTKVGVQSSPKWLGNKNFENVFAALKFEPTDRFKMVYKFDQSRGVNTPEARAPVAINRASFIGNLLGGILDAQPAGGGRYGPIVLDPSNKRPKATNNAWTQEGFQRSQGHSLTTTFELNDSLSFKNISAYRKSEVYGPSTILGLSGLEFNAGGVGPYALFAAASTPGFASLTPVQQGAAIAAVAGALAPAAAGRPFFAAYEGNSYGKGHQYSTETQVNYSSDFVDVTAGALYYHAKELNSGLPGFAPNFAFAIVPSTIPLGNIQDSTSTTTSIAGYVQGEFHLTPKLDIVAGGRLTRDKKHGGLLAGGIFIGSRTGEGSIVSGTGAQGSPALTNFPFTFKKTKPTFSLGANYKPNEDTLLYAKVSTAFLSGGAVGQLAFDPETVLAEEVGLKSEFLDRRLRVNAALWNAKYKHSQAAASGANILVGGVPQSQLGVVVVDNGPLKAKGAELEVVAVPVRGVSVGGSLGYTDAKLANPSQLLAQGRPFKLTGVAKWVGQVNGQYETQPLFGDATMLFRLDGNYQGKYRNIPFADVATATPVFAPYEFSRARWIVNGRIALRDVAVGPANLEVGLWGRNLTNNRDVSYFLLFGDFSGNSSFQQARTYGVDVIAKF